MKLIDDQNMYVGEADGPIEDKKVKIVTVRLVMDNNKIIKLLKERGDAIKSENWKKVEEKDAEIEKIQKH